MDQSTFHFPFNKRRLFTPEQDLLIREDYETLKSSLCKLGLKS